MAMRVQGGRMVPANNMQATEFVTDMVEAGRLLDQVYNRLRDAMVQGKSGGVNPAATQVLEGIGADIRGILSKLDRAAQNAKR